MAGGTTDMVRVIEVDVVEEFLNGDYGQAAGQNEGPVTPKPAPTCTSARMRKGRQRGQPQVVVALEVAQRIADRALARQSLKEICDAERMSPREVRAVLAPYAIPPRQPR